MKQTKQTNSIVRLVHLPMLMADMIQEPDCIIVQGQAGLGLSLRPCCIWKELGFSSKCRYMLGWLSVTKSLSTQSVTHLRCPMFPLCNIACIASY